MNCRRLLVTISDNIPNFTFKSLRKIFMIVFAVVFVVKWTFVSLSNLLITTTTSSVTFFVLSKVPRIPIRTDFNTSIGRKYAVFAVSVSLDGFWNMTGSCALRFLRHSLREDGIVPVDVVHTPITWVDHHNRVTVRS